VGPSQRVGRKRSGTLGPAACGQTNMKALTHTGKKLVSRNAFITSLTIPFLAVTHITRRLEVLTQLLESQDVLFRVITQEGNHFQIYLLPLLSLRVPQLSPYDLSEQSHNYKGRDSAVGIETDYGLDDRGSNPGESKECFSSTLCPDRPWDPPSLLSNGYRGFFP
jgi:hypothetical protein